MELLQLECSTYQSTLPLRSSQSSVLFSQLSGFWSFTTRDQSSNMVVHKFFILSLVITQALCAPSPCIESCTHQKQYQSQASNIQDHSGLSQIASHSQGLDYSRPGTWSEHNDYDVDSGHGKVHEERGQLVEGPKTVRYYKKNYTSSYSTGYSNGAGLSEINQQSNNDRHGVRIPTADDIQNSQRTYSQVGSAESIAQQQRNNRIYNQQLTQSSLRRTNAQSERLEDLGEYSGNMHTIQHGASDVNTQVSQGPHNTNTDSGNWSKVDSYKTDGGHGRVFEEEGQYMSGAKKVRYYKRNFTSNYSSSDGLPIPNVAKSGVLDIHKEIENLHREIGKGLSQSSTIGTMGSSNIAQTYINAHDSSSDQLHGVNSNYRDRDNYESSLSAGHRNEEQHFVDSANQRVLYSNPSPNNYDTNSYSTYERNERRLTKLQPSSQVINPTSGYTSVLSTGNAGYHTNRFSGVAPQQHTDNLQQAEVLDTHQSKLVQNQMFLDNLRSNAHAQNSGYHSVAPGQTSNYREHWSASHTKQTSVPQFSSDISDTNQHMSQYNSNQYERRHNTHQAMHHQGSYTHQFREDGMNSARNTHLGKLITGALDLSQVGHDTVDCEHSAGHTHSHSQYHTKYKRSASYNKQDEIEQVGSKVLDDDSSQHTGQFDDFTQQASGKLELDQESQQSYQPWKPNPTNERLEDLTQQTGGFDDLTQQTSGKLEFGQESQQSYQPWKPTSTSSKLEDLTQQTGGSDDLTQETSGKLEFAQESQKSYEPWKPNPTNEGLEDLTQQTGGFDDLTQQTAGKLEFGQESQQSYQPWKPTPTNEGLEDLTQQTGGFDDLTQQTSGKLEFGQESQQSYQPWKPTPTNSKLEDLAQQTSGFDDFTQQSSGKLEVGQESQQSYEPWKPQSANQKLEDLTQQTGGFDDFTQQTSGKLELDQESQQSYQPWKPNPTNEGLEDLTQQTGGFDDLTQQTAGKLEYGQESQQTYQPWKPKATNQKLDDLTQQTGGFYDPTQQTSGKLEFDQESQQSYEPWKPPSANQNLEDLTQQTGGFHDPTQQTSGKLEFGQESQQSYEPWKPQSANQKLEDLTQQTGQLDDFTQQSSGKLEFGQDSQQSYEPWKPQSANQKLEDITQQTGGFDDFTQETSGKLEYGQESQQSYQPWKPTSTSSKLEDLTQQTRGSDDLTQQTSEKLEFGQESQQSYEPWKPQSANQKLEDLTQQTGGFDDFTQQTSGKLEYGQESQQTYHPWDSNSANHKLQVFNQKTDDVSTPQELDSHTLKPAEKPKPKSRYSRYGSVINVQVPNQNIHTTNNQGTLDLNGADAPSIYELPPHVDTEDNTDSVRNQDRRGDQDLQSTTNGDVPKNLNERTESNGYDTEGGNVDQVNWFHKSNNDATVGLQWHYTYHPSDQRQFVQPTDQKDKEGMQQQSSEPNFSNLQPNLDRETQNLYTIQHSNQQLGYNWPSQNQAAGEGVKTTRRNLSPIQQQNKLLTNQDSQKNSRSTESPHQLEPRILEAYGGGEYDPHHSDDIYSGVTINPSATLPPTNDMDPWYIREKPREVVTTEESTLPPLPVESLNVDDVSVDEGSETNETTTPANVWSRIGNKITSTFDKARERARVIFG